MTRDWWVPINWASTLLQKNLPNIEARREVIRLLNDFQHNLTVILEYHHNPLPSLAHKAVTFICWGFAVAGAFASQTSTGKNDLWWSIISVSQ